MQTYSPRSQAPYDRTVCKYIQFSLTENSLHAPFAPPVTAIERRRKKRSERRRRRKVSAPHLDTDGLGHTP